MNEAIKYIQDTYRWATENELVHNKSQFALAVGTNYSAMTQFLRGNVEQPRLDGSRVAKRVKIWRESVEQKAQMKHTTLPPDLMLFRREAAKDAMRSMINACSKDGIFPDPEEVCGMAVLYADNLIKQLGGAEK